MAPRSATMGAASRSTAEFAPLRAPTPGSANSFSKGTPQVATPPQTTFCQYLGSLVTKLDRAARIPKLIVECGTTINSRMFTKIRNLRLNNNLKFNLVLGLIASTGVNSFCAAAAAEIPDYVLRENLYGPKLDDNEFGDEFGSVPGVTYRNPKGPFEDVIWSYNDRCEEMFEQSSQRFSKARNLATVNYYPTTLDFQQFRNHDLIPENRKHYSWGNKLAKGHAAPGFNNEGHAVSHGTCEFKTPEGSTWSSERIGPFYSTGGYDWWQVAWADIFGLKEKLEHPQEFLSSQYDSSHG